VNQLAVVPEGSLYNIEQLVTVPMIVKGVNYFEGMIEMFHPQWHTRGGFLERIGSGYQG
jgi:hypothetical protein